MKPNCISRTLITGMLASYLLSGCVATQTGTTGPSSSKPPVVSSRDVDQARQRTTPASSFPAETSSKPVFQGNKQDKQAQKIPVSYADIEFVQQRLNEYQDKLDLWLKINEIDHESNLADDLSAEGIECLQLLERILTGYNLLLDRMQQNQSVPVDRIATVDPKKMQQLDIAFLESRCSETLVTDEPMPATGQPVEMLPGMAEATLQDSYGEAEKSVITHVENDRYQEAVLAYNSLQESYPDQTPSVFTQLNYGLALQYSGQVETAAKHFTAMLSSGTLSVEPLKLQLEIADLLLANGNTAAAETAYEKFLLAYKSVEIEQAWAEEQLNLLRSVDPGSEEMLSYIKLLRDFQIYDYRIHSVALNKKLDIFIREHSSSPVAESARHLKNFSDEQLHAWFGRQLLRIDYLVSANRFSEATAILNNMTHYYLPADLQAIVQRTYYEVGQTEIQETENQRLLQEMELNENWETAVHLMDSREFDAAILAFEALMGTEYEEQANQKIIEAANLAAAQMRKEAASLFSKAVKTSDIALKEELLLDSHRLLNEILVRFPQTELLDKVHQNIIILEEQISKIDPALLEELRQEKQPGKDTWDADPFSRQY